MPNFTTQTTLAITPFTLKSISPPQILEWFYLSARAHKGFILQFSSLKVVSLAMSL